MHNILTTLAATLSTGKLPPSQGSNSDTGVYTVGGETDLLGSVTGIINGVIGVLGFVSTT